ncbi:hypothetical protein WDU94_000964 [Cyamophila willieti]
MPDMFFQNDARSLLDGKYILLIGDSNTLSLYKDIVCLLARGTLLTQRENQTKGELRFLGDRRTRFDDVGGSKNYFEDREYLLSQNNIKVEFISISRVNSTAIHKKLRRISKQPPDVVLYNSTLSHLSRWRPKDKLLKKNLVNLMHCLKKKLLPSTLVIWLTAANPSSKEMHSGRIVKQNSFFKTYLHFDILELNRYAAQIVDAHGFDVLDVHYYTRLMCPWGRPDGVHYSTLVVRYITNLTLAHIARAWNVSLSGRVECNNVKQEVMQMDDFKATPNDRVECNNVTGGNADG